LLILSLAATAAPAASAMPARLEPASAAPPTAIYSRQDKSTIPTTLPATAAATVANVSAPPPAVRIGTPTRGFDWLAAGIGVAGGIALSMLGLGGARGLSQYRTRRTRHAAVLSD
jgi:hypothetical protein